MRSDTVSSLLSLLALAGMSSAGILPDGFLSGGPKNLCAEAATATTTVTVEALRKTTVTATTTYTVSSMPTCSAVSVPAPVVQSFSPSGNTGNTNSNAATCLSDEQAKWIVDSFKTILTHPDRSVAKSTAVEVIADEFLETSDSVNSLNDIPVSPFTILTQDFLSQR